jgi:hypothetical protein
MGHNTPTNALASTREQTNEAHNAKATDRFFTSDFSLIWQSKQKAHSGGWLYCTSRSGFNFS